MRKACVFGLLLSCVAALPATRAEGGDASGQYFLGTLLADGTAIARDYGEAMSWLKKAADQGHAKAQYNLGVMYANGMGVPEDPAAAAEWFRKAADNGEEDARKALEETEAGNRR